MARPTIRLRPLDILDSIRGIRDTIGGAGLETYRET
jgi:hypothetical protein